MRHEDFASLEVEDVMAKVLGHAQAQLGGQVHWISAHALEEIRKQKDEDWLSGSFEAKLMGKHGMSLPKAETFDLLHVWFKIASMAEPLKPQIINAAPSRYFMYPLVHEDKCTGVVLCENFSSEFAKVMVAQLKDAFDIAAKYVKFAYELQAAKELSFTDDLTGLNNQRYLPQVLQHEIERAKRDGGAFSLLFLDLDFFKAVNDAKGHLTGSHLLGVLGRLLRDQVRASDHAFRYGGDEFILVLAGSDGENSARVAERIRDVVEKTRFVANGEELRLTISIGVASYPGHGQSAEDLIRVADQAMYSAKKKSRNVVYIAPKVA